MSEFPVATSPAPGVMGVDRESGVDFERLRQYRLGRVRMMLDELFLRAGFETYRLWELDMQEGGNVKMTVNQMRLGGESR